MSKRSKPPDVELVLTPGGDGNRLSIGGHDVSRFVDAIELRYDVNTGANTFPAIGVRFRGIIEASLPGSGVHLDGETIAALQLLGWTPPPAPPEIEAEPAGGWP